MNRSVVITILIALLLAGAASYGVAASSITLRTEYPTEGEAVELFVQDEAGMPVAGAEVKVTYRPGSSVEREVVVGTTGADGRARWVPESAGIASLSASWGEEQAASTNVSVKFGSTPVGGVIIMLFAGILLVGGSVVRLLRVARADR